MLPDSHYEFSSQYLWQKGSSINFLRCIFTLFCFVFLKIMRKYSVSTGVPRIDIEMLPALLLPFQSLINFAGFYPKKTPTTSVALFRNIFLVEFTRWRGWSFHTSCASADVCISLPGWSCASGNAQDDSQALGMHWDKCLSQCIPREKVLAGEGEGSSLPTQLPIFPQRAGVVHFNICPPFLLVWAPVSVIHGDLHMRINLGGKFR